MTYKMYLLDIRDLEDKSLSEEAMALIDDKRREIANKYCKEKDRLRAIVAGLLLQAAFLELEPEATFGREVQAPCVEISKPQIVNGHCYRMESKGLIAYLKECAEKVPDVFPLKLCYEKGEQGKPFWNRPVLEAEFAEEICLNKKLWHFNISHSGEYVVLVAADVEVGVDIQEAREVKNFSGGYKAFSRMEAFVKCTGDGYAKGYSVYEEYHGAVPGYEIQSMHVKELYALNVCFNIAINAERSKDEKESFSIRKDKL